MTVVRERRPEFRTPDSWAIGILLAVGAIRECEDHGYMKCRADPDARQEAFKNAREQPLAGLSPEEAAARIRDALDSIGDTCPDC